VLRKKHKRYYIPYESGRIWSRKYKEWFHSFKPVPPFPEDIQIQTITGCNASCAFCPQGKTKNPFPQEKMEDDLYHKIIDECLKKPVKRISPYLMNEPLLDRQLGWKVSILLRKKPSSLSIKVNTNASLLKGNTVEDILNSGLDRLNISFHGISKEVYEKNMQGLDYEETLNNVNNFLESKSKMNAEKPKVTITMVRTKWIEQEIDKINSYWGEKDVSIHIQPLDNRANECFKDKGLNLNEWEPYRWCKRLFTQAYILYNGDMVLCCVDWERTTILGNVRDMTIEEVWNGESRFNTKKVSQWRSSRNSMS